MEPLATVTVQAVGNAYVLTLLVTYGVAFSVISNSVSVTCRLGADVSSG